MIDIKWKRSPNGYYFATATTASKNADFLSIADTHAGSATYDEHLLKEVIRRIKTNGWLWIGLGDLLECAHKASVGAGVYDQLMKPQEQVCYMAKLLEPIAHLCLGMVKGNHEERIYKTVGMDPMQSLCERLKIPYAGWEIYGGIIRPGQHSVSFYGVHGYSAHKNFGLMSAAVERDIKTWCNADIVFRGHSHDNGAMPVDVVDIDLHNKSVTEKRQYIVGPGHYMRRANSYIASRGARPKPCGTTVLHISLVQKDLRIKPEEVP